MRTIATTSQQSSEQEGSFAAFKVPHFGAVWLSGLIWHLCRWGVAFLGTYLVNDLTGSPRLVQLTGTTLYAPLLVGGLAGGVVSDRFDRLRTVRFQLSLLIPLTIGIALLVRSERIEVWMIYVYMFIVGIGWITDMTSRRALVFDVVGPDRLDNAMALESLSLSSGMVIGALVGGTAVEAVGVGSSYFFIAGFLILALLILAPVTSPSAIRSPAGPMSSNNTNSPVKDLIDGVRKLRSSRGVVSVLGVTAIANFFLFAYFPIVPVVAEKLNASPFKVGLLLSGTGIGMMTGSLIVARLAPFRRGLVYLFGVFLAMAFIVPFALGTNYWMVFGSIILSGVGGGFFGSTQSALIIAEAPEELRGRALGLLSMAIGALPIGMASLGELAERLGVSTALTINVAAGAVLLVIWSIRRPEVRQMTAS